MNGQAGTGSGRPGVRGPAEQPGGPAAHAGSAVWETGLRVTGTRHGPFARAPFTALNCIEGTEWSVTHGRRLRHRACSLGSWDPAPGTRANRTCTAVVPTAGGAPGQQGAFSAQAPPLI